MIDPVARTALRQELVELLAGDPRVGGVAVTGSAARDVEDAWSDVDLAAGAHDGADVRAVLDGVEAHLRRSHGAVDVLPLSSGTTAFRVVLLPGGLQVDVSVAPAADFGPRGPAFRLVHGRAGAPPPYPDPDARDVVGTGWLYALHLRSALARGAVWQAVHLVDGMREQVVTLACLRSGLPASQGRGVDRLPQDVRVRLAATLVGAPAAGLLLDAFAAAVEALLVECAHVDPRREQVLAPVLLDLVQQAREASGAGAGDDGGPG